MAYGKSNGHVIKIQDGGGLAGVLLPVIISYETMAEQWRQKILGYMLGCCTDLSVKSMRCKMEEVHLSPKSKAAAPTDNMMCMMEVHL